MNTKWTETITGLLSRKFIAVMSSIVSTHMLVHDKYIADGVYSAVMIAVVAAYVVANVAQKAMPNQEKLK